MKTSLIAFLYLLSLTAGLTAATVTEPPAAETALSQEEVRARKLAVTLNYCHAALHRIRNAESMQTVREEQQRILNNIDLNQINDPEVIALYRSILDEIGTLTISSREQTVISDGFNRDVQRKMGTDLFVMGAQAATGQLGSLIQTGAASWWDYRNTQARADKARWDVQRNQLQSVYARSSTFLDSFWKLSRDNQIPDRWLLRPQNLDKLEENLAIEDPEERLRALRRQERFMQCYPPYWYYVARTQQRMGDAVAAEETFRKLVEIGRGHFRQDDMLAGSLANLALMEEARGDRMALDTARSAWELSSVNWEANIICAAIMSRHQKYDEAEDLLLCNVEEGLEEEQSAVSLVWLHYTSGDHPQLARMLQNPRYVGLVPIPALLMCAQKLGPEELPECARRHLASTLTAVPGNHGGVSTIAVAAVPGWKLHQAETQISAGTVKFNYAGYRQIRNGTEVSFTPALRTAYRNEFSGDLLLHLQYPATPPIEVRLSREAAAPARIPPRFPGVLSPLIGTPQGESQPAQSVYHVSEIRIEDLKLSFEDQQPVALANPSRIVARDDFSRADRGVSLR